ncbi:MAG: putative polymerase ECF-subfamily sigma factor [Frankiales bacterium]|nr:putative polymerase ECF-subfamily sigma factor [Frankiales bacterium]
MLAATVRVTGDLDLAEECAQDAFARALTRWPVDGVPRSPGAWLTTVARNRAIDLLRRESSLRSRLPLLIQEELLEHPEQHEIQDERLRLVFTCCHPALAVEAQVALTLRLLCGVSTADVARAFLVSEPTMAARITRAKRKIAQAGIPYRVPAGAELPERVDAVLAVLHLVFTTGHTAPHGAALVRTELVQRATDLTRMLHELLPTPEVSGLLALVLLHDARRATRTDDAGRLVLLEQQDRSRWDREMIDEGLSLVHRALTAGPPGRYALQGAIAAVHAGAASWQDTDWREIAALYGLLEQRWPSPVVALNRAVAVGLAEGPRAGLDLLDLLGRAPALAAYPYLPAARADFLRRLGFDGEARTAYEEALLLTGNDVERAFLAERLRVLPP